MHFLCARCGARWTLPDGLSDSTRAEAVHLHRQQRNVDFVRLLLESGVSAKAAKATLLHLTQNDACHRCGAPLPAGDPVDCPACGALNARWSGLSGQDPADTRRPTAR
jgi:DNA-directed RNA polymerase subunit RPC12/RpoP